MGYWNQQMVPIKEMTDVLKVVKEVTNLKPKSWVRLKRGIYKDDIAQIEEKIFPLMTKFAQRPNDHTTMAAILGIE
ncbi:transcription hypothetical protein [Limosa lapponica baueri]|uniref:Uncharacterized protein n=1 Tax=Limosa lapponica baueri TaxID=1758121 RepID=A0A2I0URJ8_LIMLA|nr:transcription hypothetical protein [Limosa lapponica baueri]